MDDNDSRDSISDDDGKDFRNNLIKNEFKKRKPRSSSSRQSITEQEAPSWDCPLKEASNFAHIRGLSVKARQHCLNIIQAALKDNVRECSDSPNINSLLHQAESRSIDLEYDIFLKSKIHTTYRANCVKKANEIKESTKKGSRYDPVQAAELPVKKELVQPRLIAEDTIYADEDELDDEDEIFSMVRSNDEPAGNEALVSRSVVEGKKRTGRTSSFVTARELASGSDGESFSNYGKASNYAEIHSDSDFDNHKRKPTFVTARHMLSSTSTTTVSDSVSITANNVSNSVDKDDKASRHKSSKEDKISRHQSSDCRKLKQKSSKTSPTKHIKEESERSLKHHKDKKSKKLSEGTSKLHTMRKNKVKSASITSFFKREPDSDGVSSASVLNDNRANDKKIEAEKRRLKSLTKTPSPPLATFCAVPKRTGVNTDSSSDETSCSELVRKRFLDVGNFSSVSKKPKIHLDDDVGVDNFATVIPIDDDDDCDVYHDNLVDNEITFDDDKGPEELQPASNYSVETVAITTNSKTQSRLSHEKLEKSSGFAGAPDTNINVKNNKHSVHSNKELKKSSEFMRISNLDMKVNKTVHSMHSRKEMGKSSGFALASDLDFKVDSKVHSKQSSTPAKEELNMPSASKQSMAVDNEAQHLTPSVGTLKNSSGFIRVSDMLAKVTSDDSLQHTSKDYSTVRNFSSYEVEQCNIDNVQNCQNHEDSYSKKSSHGAILHKLSVSHSGSKSSSSSSLKLASKNQKSKVDVKQVANIVVKFLNPYMNDGRIASKVKYQSINQSINQSTNLNQPINQSIKSFNQSINFIATNKSICTC